jgi:hypothetical protein
LFHDKYWVIPHNDHLYDILFVPSGPCTYKAEKQLVDALERRIVRGAGKTGADEAA